MPIGVRLFLIIYLFSQMCDKHKHKGRFKVFKLIFFAETEFKDQVKNELFSLGLGKYNGYDSCCYETKGTGQFRPLVNSNPKKGYIDKLEVIEEYRIEMICSDDLIEKAVAKLKEVHPYEVPAYDVIKLYNI